MIELDSQFLFQSTPDSLQDRGEGMIHGNGRSGVFERGPRGSGVCCDLAGLGESAAVHL